MGQKVGKEIDSLIDDKIQDITLNLKRISTKMEK